MEPVKHTPGPWKYNQTEHSIECNPTSDNTCKCICEMISSRSPEETAANAILIQAAPKMLHVLKQTEQYLNMSFRNSKEDHVLETMKTMIKKAISDATQPNTIKLKGTKHKSQGMSL